MRISDWIQTCALPISEILGQRGADEGVEVEAEQREIGHESRDKGWPRQINLTFTSTVADLHAPRHFRQLPATVMQSPICTLLDIEFPLLAFSHCRDVVVAVSKAGGMGVFGAAALPSERLEDRKSVV